MPAVSGSLPFESCAAWKKEGNALLPGSTCATSCMGKKPEICAREVIKTKTQLCAVQSGGVNGK